MGKTVADGRKAIVTLADVQEAFNGYTAIRESIGVPVAGHSFDRGARGKGYAEYDSKDNIVRPFDGKEEALTFYGRYVEVANEVLAAPLVTVVAPAAESNEEATEEATPTIPAQKTRRAAKAS